MGCGIGGRLKTRVYIRYLYVYVYIYIYIYIYICTHIYVYIYLCLICIAVWQKPSKHLNPLILGFPGAASGKEPA